MSTSEPKLPQAKAVTVDVAKTAVLVQDLAEDCGDPTHPSHKLVPGMSRFLDDARSVGMLIIFTVSLFLKGKPTGQVYSRFKRKPSEAVLFPDGFDKFTGGELQGLLSLYEDINTLIITGCRSNINVLHTATTAWREFRYNVIIPIDGLAAVSDYEEQYTLFHLANLPGEYASPITFTKLDMVRFQPGGKRTTD